MSRITRCRGPEGAMPPHIYSPAMIGRAPGSIRRGFDPRKLASLWETPAFLHIAGDGNTPTIGPALTTTGTITDGSPIVLASGGALRTDAYTGTQNRTTAIATEAAIGDDLVTALCGKVAANVAIKLPHYRYNGVTARGAYFAKHGGTTLLECRITGDTVFTQYHDIGIVPFLVLMVAKRGGNTRYYRLPGSVLTAATPAGDISGGGRLTLCNGTTADWAWVCEWIGAGIADLWDADRIAELYALAGVA